VKLKIWVYFNKFLAQCTGAAIKKIDTRYRASVMKNRRSLLYCWWSLRNSNDRCTIMSRTGSVSVWHIQLAQVQQKAIYTVLMLLHKLRPFFSVYSLYKMTSVTPLNIPMWYVIRVSAYVRTYVRNDHKRAQFTCVPTCTWITYIFASGYPILCWSRKNK
jgi:hypothetical protein